MPAAAPEDHFDRAKPFYPLVTVYVLGLRGFTEMAVRGIVQLHEQVTGTVCQHPSFGANLTGDQEIDAGLRKLRGPLNLRAECIGGPINVPMESVAQEIAENHGAVLPWVLPSLGSVLMLAHEIVVQQLTEAERLEPVPQFLRHLRNAVGHNGRFLFAAGQPNKPAIWRRFTLDASLHDTPVFSDGTVRGLLGPGDPIRLLWDIEQQYPSLKV